MALGNTEINAQFFQLRILLALVLAMLFEYKRAALINHVVDDSDFVGALVAVAWIGVALIRKLLLHYKLYKRVIALIKLKFIGHVYHLILCIRLQSWEFLGTCPGRTLGPILCITIFRTCELGARIRIHLTQIQKASAHQILRANSVVVPDCDPKLSLFGMESKCLVPSRSVACWFTSVPTLFLLAQN